MSRFERQARLLKIITMIKARDNLNREELARRCEVSVRTVQRDLNTLVYAGIPIIWDLSYQRPRGRQTAATFFQVGNKERREVKKMAKKGVPKKDGSGGGTRKNRGRGGHTPRKTGKGRNRK